MGEHSIPICRTPCSRRVCLQGGATPGPIGCISMRSTAFESMRREAMTIEELREWTIALGSKDKLSAEIRQRISRELPSFIRDIDPKTAPKTIKLPTGESLGDATRITAIKCHSLLLARKIHGAG